MKVLLTGGKGQLGLAIQRVIKESGYDWQVISTDHDTLDITEMKQVENVLKEAQVDVVINCAAHTAVDQCEQDVDNAYLINAIGPRNLAVVCETLGVKLVQVSTDYVFSGEFNLVGEEQALPNTIEQCIEQAKLSASLKEDHLVAPQSIYGKSKLMGEEVVRTFCKKHFIIRTAWLYGEGNNFVRTMLKLAETNDELNVVADQFGNPTNAKDLARAIINLIQTTYYGTYHGTCEGICSWYDFACKIFELRGIEIKVNQVTSEAFVRPAKRPAYSSLDNFMLKLQGLNTFRPWEEALQDYLNEEIGERY